MRVRVLFFATLRKIAGDSADIHLPDESTLNDLFWELCRQHPPLEQWSDTVQFSINQEWAKRTQRLHDGDEVAIMPPVSGG